MASPASLGTANSWPSGDWPLWPCSWVESPALNRVGRPRACPLRTSEARPGHRNSYPGLYPRLLEMFLTKVAVTVPGQGSGESPQSPGPATEPARLFTFCHLKSHIDLEELLSLSEPQ